MPKRSNKRWENQFISAKIHFNSTEAQFQITNDKDWLVDHCTGLRNPICFDNNLNEVIERINESYVSEGKTTEDHLLGMSNMVLLIFKKGIYKKWETVEDFKKSLKLINVVMKVDKSLNDKKEFKGWKFSYDNVEDCIFWYKKFYNSGVYKTDSGRDIKEVWEEWYEEFDKMVD